MGTPIINGSIAAIVQPVEITYDPVRGISYQQEFISAGDNLGGLANSLMLARCAFHWVKSPVLSTITATWSGGQGSVSDTAAASWQLLGNEMQSSVWESQMALSLGSSELGSARAGAEAILRGDLRLTPTPDGASSETIANSVATDISNYLGLDSTLSTTAGLLVGFIIRGQSHFAQGQYVVKRTISVSNFYTADLGFVSAEALVLTSDLLALGPTPSIANAIGGLTGGTPHDGYLFSWRQLPPQVVTAANNRSEVSTEWWWGEWSTDLYSVMG